MFKHNSAANCMFYFLIASIPYVLFKLSASVRFLETIQNEAFLSHHGEMWDAWPKKWNTL